jgi:hypothetical protein
VGKIELDIATQREVEQREMDVGMSWNSSLPKAWLRAVRAIAVLEHIGRPEAREVIEAVSRGAPSALPTQKAKAALERLKSPATLRP